MHPAVDDAGVRRVSVFAEGCTTIGDDMTAVAAAEFRDKNYKRRIVITKAWETCQKNCHGNNYIIIIICRHHYYHHNRYSRRSPVAAAYDNVINIIFLFRFR